MLFLKSPQSHQLLHFMRYYRFIAMMLLLPFTANAEGDENSPWSTEVGLGYHALSGNADTQSIRSRISTSYTDDSQEYLAEADFLQVEKDGEEAKRKSTYEIQGNFSLSDHAYVLANATYASDRYGPYFDDLMFATGLGYQVYDSEELSLNIEAGPGFRYQKPNLDEIRSSDLIMPHNVSEAVARGQVKFKWLIRDNVTFDSRVTVVSGSSNTSVESRVALSTGLSERLALNLANSQKYISTVPPGLENRDSSFSVNLIYSF